MATDILAIPATARRRSVGVARFQPPPRKPNDPVAELITNLVSLHHLPLRRRLRELESLLDHISLDTGSDLSLLRRKLSILHQEVVCSLLRAEHVAFPQILALADAARADVPSLASLRQSVQRCGCSLEAEHVTALQAIWSLLRLADQIDGAGASNATRAFRRALTEFSTRFYAYLHELHFMLIQRVAGIDEFYCPGM